MFETLLGGVFGGVLRLAPEVFKIFDRAHERKHELALLQAEMEFAKVKGDLRNNELNAEMTTQELATMAEAIKEQSTTARAAGRWVAAFSALVRPIVTYQFILLYVGVKIAAFFLALQQGGSWQQVVVSLWTSDDMVVLNMILSFWFVGRVYERLNK